jgi:hypothetical protein
MALIESFDLAGQGIVTSFNKSNRNYRVGEANDFIDYRETITTEAREWVGLTYNAALTQVERNVQPGDKTATFTWSFREDNRIVGSYVVERLFESKATTTTGSTDIPNMVIPLMTAGRAPNDIGHYLDHAVGGFGTVFVTKRNTGSKLFYKWGYARNNTGNANTAAKNSVNWQDFNNASFFESTSTSPIFVLEFFLSTDNGVQSIFTGASRNNNGFRKIARVYAKEEIVKLTGVYTSEVDRIYYADNDPF